MAERSVTLLGVGIYTRAEVAKLLRLSATRVSSWVRGYRYTWGPREARRRGQQPAVIKTDIPTFDGTLAISFLELMELRIIKEFRDQGIPLQTVRVAWGHAARAFKSDHPFADHRVFTDAGKIFLSLADEDPSVALLEVSSRQQPFQLVAGPIFKSSLQRIKFDERSHLAREYWPQGRSTPIVLNPDIAFGASGRGHTRAHQYSCAVRSSALSRKRR